MRKKQEKKAPQGFSNRVNPVGSEQVDFYSGSPVEKPLSADRRTSDSRRVRRTERHQAVAGHRKETMDPREKMALMAILKLVVLILLLMIAFLMLWKGIGLYEESILMKQTEEAAEPSSVREAITLVETFDITDQTSRDKFGERIEHWQEANRLVRSADALLQRNIYDQAILQCQDALAKDPSHRGALERLARLYDAKEMHAEAVNTYIRLMSVDPSDQEIQKDLIAALAALEDYKAVKYMTHWYLDQNLYDGEVQHHLADALYALEEFEAAVEAYDRLLRTAPKNVHALEQRAASLMQIGQYDKALVSLELLREYNLRNPSYYKRVVVCNAQLKRGKETVQALGRSAHLFGEQIVIGWLKDPQLDPVREDRDFQAFTDRVGGEEFRRWLEKMAHTMEAGSRKKEIGPQLEMPTSKFQDEELLKLRNR